MTKVIRYYVNTLDHDQLIRHRDTLKKEITNFPQNVEEFGYQTELDYTNKRLEDLNHGRINSI